MRVLAIWTALVSVVFAGGSRTVCELQVRSDGAVQARGDCPTEVVGAAHTFVASAGPVRGVHPQEIVVDGVAVKRVRVVLGRGQPRARLRPVARVHRRVLPEVSPTFVAPESCTARLSVDRVGEVERVDVVDCGSAAELVARVAGAWTFRPLTIDGEQKAFHTVVDVPIVRRGLPEGATAGVETAGELVSR